MFTLTWRLLISVYFIFKKDRSTKKKKKSHPDVIEMSILPMQKSSTQTFEIQLYQIADRHELSQQTAHIQNDCVQK